jgi:hypothetical protein
MLLVTLIGMIGLVVLIEIVIVVTRFDLHGATAPPPREVRPPTEAASNADWPAAVPNISMAFQGMP